MSAYTAGHSDHQAPFSGDETDDADDAELALYAKPAFCKIDSLTIPLIDLFAPRDLYANSLGSSEKMLVFFSVAWLVRALAVGCASSEVFYESASVRK